MTGQPSALGMRGLPLGRAAAFAAIWLVLTEASLKDLPVGIVAVAAASFVSVRLLPMSDTRLAPLALTRYAVTFLRQSILAGLDIALRAFDPKLPLKPGFVGYSASLPDGPARSLFASLSSMAPGTLPAGESADGAILVHCLDESADVVGQMRADETKIAAALGEAPRHG